jgi:hypothetical protein
VVAECYLQHQQRGLIPLSTNIEVVGLEGAKTWSFAPPPPGGDVTLSDGYGVFRMSLIPGEYVAYVLVNDTWQQGRPFVIRANRATYVTMIFRRESYKVNLVAQK